MLRRFLLLFLFFAIPALGQNIMTIPPQQCVWHTGDDPAWAAPTIDESGWQPNPHWHGFSPVAHLWVRCHADLTSLRVQTQPAIQVTLYGAYQLFVNGQPLGGNGNVHPGAFGLNVIRQYPLDPATLDKPPATIALRIGYHVFGQLPLTAALNMDPPILHAGDMETLTAQRAKIVLSESTSLLPSAALGAFTGVLGLTLLGLFYYDRARLDLLYLSILVITLAVLRVNNYCMSLQLNYSSALRFAINQVGNMSGAFVPLLFFFALARRRAPRLYLVPITLIVAQFSLSLMSDLLPAQQGLALFSWQRTASETTMLPAISWVVTSTAAFVAFWPYHRITQRMRPIAAFSILWGAADFVWFAVETTNNPRLGIPNFFRLWEFQMLEIRGVITACIPIALLVLLFRDQRQVTEERALLAGEMQAASQIQRMLAPAAIDCAPGLQIDVAFHPMREVGGDFYLCRVLPDGRQRILVGDVSGKGSAAAMTAALLLGGAADHDSESPAALLAHLNRVLMNSMVGGFATCLCADLTSGGDLVLANAGHLPPYCRGEELNISPGLPLGVAADTSYSETSLDINAGETLTFLSDGVVEARNTSGELFGFDRARSLSSRSAEQIAQAAQSFGQEDDITILTLTFAPVGVVNA